VDKRRGKYWILFWKWESVEMGRTAGQGAYALVLFMIFISIMVNNFENDQNGSNHNYHRIKHNVYILSS